MLRLELTTQWVERTFHTSGTALQEARGLEWGEEKGNDAMLRLESKKGADDAGPCRWLGGAWALFSVAREDIGEFWAVRRVMLPDLKEAGSSVCMFRTKVKHRDQGGGYCDGPGRKVAGQVWDLKWMDSEI